jgi:hypothetical protein
VDRNTVFATIEGERSYQDKMSNGKVLPIEGEILLIDNYLQQAKSAYTKTRNDDEETPTREVIRKIAAICVRCMEHHGSPPRIY